MKVDHPTAPYIWIVDDDASVLRSMRRLVHSLDFEVEVWESGEELLEQLAEVWPTCILLDIHMSRRSGIETLREIRARGILVPTVMMTGVEREGVRETCLAAGALDVVAKPVAAHTILDILERIKGGSR